MKIKLDVNLPERLVTGLAAVGHDVDTVRAEQLAGRDDTNVWRAAQTAGRFLITQDLDFSDVPMRARDARRIAAGSLAQPGRDAQNRERSPKRTARKKRLTPAKRQAISERMKRDWAARKTLPKRPGGGQ